MVTLVLGHNHTFFLIPEILGLVSISHLELVWILPLPVVLSRYADLKKNCFTGVVAKSVIGRRGRESFLALGLDPNRCTSLCFSICLVE